MIECSKLVGVGAAVGNESDVVHQRRGEQLTQGSVAGGGAQLSSHAYPMGSGRGEVPVDLLSGWRADRHGSTKLEALGELFVLDEARADHQRPAPALPEAVDLPDTLGSVLGGHLVEPVEHGKEESVLDEGSPVTGIPPVAELTEVGQPVGERFSLFRPPGEGED